MTKTKRILIGGADPEIRAQALACIDALDSLLERDPEAFFKKLADGILRAAQDIYGADSSTMEKLKSVLETGGPNPWYFDGRKFSRDDEIKAIRETGSLDPPGMEIPEFKDPVSLIASEEAGHLAISLGFELLWIHRKDVEYYGPDGGGAGVIWHKFQYAGMSVKDIGRYLGCSEVE